MTVPAHLDRRFRDAAASEGLLDVGFDVMESPVGALLLAVTPRGVCRISYDADPEAQAERLARAYGSRVLRAPRAVDDVKRELDEYFEGRREAFDLSIDLAGAAEFTRDVLHELARVPFGEVTTYGQLAQLVGRPRAARAVGTVMNRNPIPIVLPCHRVVGSTGKLVGYGGGLERKEQLLRLEGALIT
jgi:methylated-DNA-[protein]-cysteine S-methyltransferase